MTHRPSQFIGHETSTCLRSEVNAYNAFSSPNTLKYTIEETYLRLSETPKEILEFKLSRGNKIVLHVMHLILRL